MRSASFDALTRTLGHAGSRRGLLGLVLGGVAAVPATGAGAALRICLTPGQPCVVDRQCCSARCRRFRCRLPASRPKPTPRPGGCPDRQRRCGGHCVNVERHQKHCGACHRACGAGERCRAGRCRLACSPGRVICGQRCVDLRVDNQHCGGCGMACGAIERCVAGECRAVCAPGTCPEDKCVPLVDRTPGCWGEDSDNDDGAFFANDPCVPCDVPANCPPPNFLRARQCLYTNTPANVGGSCLDHAFACGFLS